MAYKGVKREAKLLLTDGRNSSDDFWIEKACDGLAGVGYDVERAFHVADCEVGVVVYRA